MQEMLLGAYIRQNREAQGLTQKQLCEGICGPVTISRIENGQQTPSRSPSQRPAPAPGPA